MNRALALAAPVVLLSLAAVALLQSAELVPVLASREGTPIDQLLRIAFSIAAAIAVLVLVVLAYSLVAFRRAPGDLSDGPPLHGNPKLEVAWTLIPLAIVLAVGIYAQGVWLDITASSAAQEEMVVDVDAFQWGWEFRYPSYAVATRELVLPQGKPVLLRLTSRDVIHSFWVREFRVKMDAVPGMETQLRVVPTKLGQYEVWCAEMCGAAHAYMRADVRVVEPDEFSVWLTAQTRR